MSRINPDVGNEVVLKTPEFESVSVRTSNSLSVLVLFVTTTTTVSIFVPLTFASVSWIVGEIASPGCRKLGNVPDDVVSAQATVMFGDVTESVAVCVST